MRGRPWAMVVSLAKAPRLGAALLLLLDVDRDQAPVGRLEVPQQVFHVHAVVPDVELGHGGVPAHPALVGIDRHLHRHFGPGGPHPVLTAGHHQAGGEALDVPLEGPAQGLVEVPQVEEQVALGGGPQPEVQDVGVAAQLDDQSAVGLAGQVGGHDGGRPPVVVPRRGGHPLVPQAHQPGHPDGVLGGDGRQRVVGAQLWPPGRHGAPGRPLARRTAGAAPFGGGGAEVVSSARRLTPRDGHRLLGPGHRGRPLTDLTIGGSPRRPASSRKGRAVRAAPDQPSSDPRRTRSPSNNIDSLGLCRSEAATSVIRSIAAWHPRVSAAAAGPCRPRESTIRSR